MVILDKTADALISILIFIVIGAIWTVPLICLNMGLLWGSLYPLFGAVGVVWYNVFKAPADPSQSLGAERIPVRLHKVLVILAVIILVLGINYVQYVAGWVPPPMLGFTIGTQAIGWLWFIGLYLQVGLGLKPSKEAAMRKAMVIALALSLTWLTVTWCLKIAPEGVSVFLPDSVVHMAVAYTILVNNIVPE
jgi:hypothetical protein